MPGNSKTTFAVFFLSVVIVISNFNLLSSSAYTQLFFLPCIDEEGSDDIIKWQDGEYFPRIFHSQSSIDIDTLFLNETSSQLELQLYGSPVLDANHEYRILICWDEEIKDVVWSKHPTVYWNVTSLLGTNVTLCVAGSGNWFGVTNGSFNLFFDQQNETLLQQELPNTVSIDNHTLYFPINSTYLDSEFSTPKKVVVFTTCDNSTGNISMLLFDANYYYFFNEFFLIGEPLASSNTNLVSIFFLFSLIVPLITFFKKQKNLLYHK